MKFARLFIVSYFLNIFFSLIVSVYEINCYPKFSIRYGLCTYF